MIHTMPDKSVRVTSRYPKGHGTVFFDLAKAHGFTLEQDGYNSDTLVLQAVGCYGNYTARYGDPVEAEADLADLNLMLADRHTLPATSSVPALASMQPSMALGHAKRRGWGWKGTLAGLPGTAETERAAGTEPGSRRGVAPAPEDHAFSGMLRQAARERDVPLTMFTDPGAVASADRELTHALVLVERAGGQSICQARLAVRQLLAERDRVLREPVAMRLPPIAPEKLAGVTRSLTATLEQGLAATSQTLPTAAPPPQVQPARLGAAGPA